MAYYNKNKKKMALTFHLQYYKVGIARQAKPQPFSNFEQFEIVAMFRLVDI